MINEEPSSEYAAPEEWYSLDLIYTLALKELEAQTKDWDKADDRLRLLLGFIGLISTVLAAAGGITGALPEEKAGPLLALQVAAAFGLAGLILAGAIAVAAYSPRNFHRPPNIQTLRLENLTQTVEATKLTIIDQILRVHPINQQMIARKLGAYRNAQWVFAGSVACLAVAIGIRLVFLTGVAVT